MSVRLLVVLIATVTVSFASVGPVKAQGNSAPSAAATARSSPPAGLRPLPVFYDPALAAKGFPNPLVKARIAGHEAIFIVDTGASVNVLADWYAEVAGIPTAGSDTRAQGTGGGTAPLRLANRVQGEWSDGQRFSLNEAIVISFPPYFESLRLGGLVSPQLLAPAGMAAVLDLGIPSLRFAPYARAVSDLRQSKAPPVPLDVTPACRDARSKFVNRLYVAPMTAAGVTDLMLVDTGATGTIFSDKSEIARVLESRSEPDPGSPPEGVGGKVNASRIVRDVQLLLGGRTVALTPSIGEVSASCVTKGKLGMDALRGCLLILGDSEMAFSCR